MSNYRDAEPLDMSLELGAVEKSQPRFVLHGDLMDCRSLSSWRRFSIGSSGSFRSLAGRAGSCPRICTLGPQGGSPGCSRGRLVALVVPASQVRSPVAQPVRLLSITGRFEVARLSTLSGNVHRFRGSVRSRLEPARTELV